MLNLYYHEIKRNWRSLLVWAVSIAILMALVMSMFPAIAEDREGLTQTIKALMPEQLMEAFGLMDVDITTILGFYTLDPYIMVVLMGSIYAFLLAAGLLTKEENDKTIEFLLCKPITRQEIISAKLLALLSNILVFNLLISLTVVILFEIFANGDYDVTVLSLLLIGPFLASVTFASIGFLLAAGLKKSKAIMPLGLGIIIGTFFLNKISNVSERLEFLQYISPFEYVDPTDIYLSGAFNNTYLFLMALIVFASISASYVLYGKKDMLVG